jgi:hypothetical protein
MEADRFDRLTRILAAAPTRRRVVGLALGSLLAILGDAASEAKGKHSRKQDKSRTKRARAQARPVCTPPEPCELCQSCFKNTCRAKATDTGCSGCRQCQGGQCVDKANGTRCGKGQTCQGGVCRQVAVCAGRNQCGSSTEHRCDREGATTQCFCYETVEGESICSGEGAIFAPAPGVPPADYCATFGAIVVKCVDDDPENPPIYLPEYCHRYTPCPDPA